MALDWHSLSHVWTNVGGLKTSSRGRCISLRASGEGRVGVVRVEDADPGKTSIFSKTGRAKEAQDGKLRSGGEWSSKSFVLKSKLSRGVDLEWLGLIYSQGSLPGWSRPPWSWSPSHSGQF